MADSRNPGSAATATLERSNRNVNVAGAIRDSVIVTGDGVQVVVEGDSGAGHVLLAELRTQIFPSPKPTPIDERGRIYGGHVGRRSEADQVMDLALSTSVINLQGEAGVGKSYLLSYALHDRSNAILPDGVLLLPAKGEPVQDLIQALFDAFYDSPAILPSSKIKRLLKDKQALIVFDSIDRPPDEVQKLLSFLPRCTVVLASRERSEGVLYRLKGLDAGDAFALVEQELGRTVLPEEKKHAELVCKLLEGHPLRIRQAISSIDSSGSLEGLATTLERSESSTLPVPALDPDETSVLRTLVALGEAVVGVKHLEALIPMSNLQAVLDELERRGLAKSHSPRYSRTSTVPEEWIAQWQLDVERQTALNYFLGWAERNRRRYKELLVESPALLELFAWTTRTGRHADTIRLGRATETAFAWGRRWGAWELILRGALEAARSVGDKTTEAWALHQLGTRAFCLGETEEALRSLREALKIRKKIRDVAGIRATKQNLEVIKPPRLLNFLRNLHLTPFVILSLLITLGFVTPRIGQLLERVQPGRNDVTEDVRGSATTRFQVRLAGGGQGVVRSDVDGKECLDRCTWAFPTNRTQATLTATAVPGSVFAGWSGDCAGVEQCVVSSRNDRSAVATFEPAAGTTPLLTVAVNGTGTGTVISSPSGIDCPGICQAPFPGDSPPWLIATADENSVFAGWKGECSGIDPCRPGLRRDTTVQAIFDKAPAGTYALAAEVRGSGSGKITSLPSGISCPPVCKANLREDVPVRLTASPDADSVFAGWKGACDGTDVRCTAKPAVSVAIGEFSKKGGGSGGGTVPPVEHRVRIEVTYDEELELRPGGWFTVTGLPDCEYTKICDEPGVPTGTSLTITAIADKGYKFGGWSGDCGGIKTETCKLTVDGDRYASLSFAAFQQPPAPEPAPPPAPPEPEPVQAQVTVSGVGAVQGPGGALCEPGAGGAAKSCFWSVTAGKPVTFTTVTGHPSWFVGWGGNCAEYVKNPTCSLTPEGKGILVQATFIDEPG